MRQNAWKLSYFKCSLDLWFVMAVQFKTGAVRCYWVERTHGVREYDHDHPVAGLAHFKARPCQDVPPLYRVRIRELCDKPSLCPQCP